MPHVHLEAPAPTRPGVLLPRRDLAVGWTLMVLIAVLAWVLTVGQARHMGMEPGTMGLALPLFLLLWVVMMAAMMLPSVAPVAITWVRGISRSSAGPTRALHIAEFVSGYLLVWTGFGLLAYGALAATGDLVRGDPQAGRWIGAGAFLLAGLHQFGPLKGSACGTAAIRCSSCCGTRGSGRGRRICGSARTTVCTAPAAAGG